MATSSFFQCSGTAPIASMKRNHDGCGDPLTVLGIGGPQTVTLSNPPDLSDTQPFFRSKLISTSAATPLRKRLEMEPIRHRRCPFSPQSAAVFLANLFSGPPGNRKVTFMRERRPFGCP